MFKIQRSALQDLSRQLGILLDAGEVISLSAGSLELVVVITAYWSHDNKRRYFLFNTSGYISLSLGSAGAFVARCAGV
jgi:hypothetical protein